MLLILNEIISSRNLIRELVVKDIKLRYSRPILGFLWAFLSPFLTVGIFYIVFSLILRVRIEEAPFVLYLMTAVFPWRFFQESLMCSATSLLDNKNLIRESNFPHYFIPLSIVLANLINFLPSLAILIITSLIYFRGLPIFIIFLPFIIMIQFLITIGLSLISALLYVRWRDVKYALEAILLILFYLTPAFYSLELVKHSFASFWHRIYIYNPFVALLNLYRLAMLKSFYPYARAEISLFNQFMIAGIFGIIIFGLGFYFYQKKKNTINDYLAY